MLNDIETAFGQRLASAPAIAPIVWPNRASAPGKPYLAVQHVPTSTDSNAISGTGGEVERGYFVVTIVTASNEFSTLANTTAQAVKARFPMGLTLTAGGRVMRFWRPAQMLPAFPDGSDWRLPVRLNYLVTGA